MYAFQTDLIDWKLAAFFVGNTLSKLRYCLVIKSADYQQIVV